jgi:ABC-2 type transport system permease protein
VRALRLSLLHAWMSTVELLRYPSFSVPTLALPALFFAFFGLPRAHGRAEVLLASFAAYAALSVAFFQFGVGIATDRVRPWESFVRTLPVGPLSRLGGRVLSAGAFATAAVGIVVAVAVPVTHPHLAAAQWSRLVLALAAGGVPFTLLGVALGYWVPPKSALPVANILYLGLSYVGGLWTGPTGLPHAIERAGQVLPTREWGEVLWEAALGLPWHRGPWLALLGYSAGFAALAVWGYRRDEGQRYR